jgi:hypothetical protein
MLQHITGGGGFMFNSALFGGKVGESRQSALKIHLEVSGRSLG